MKLRNGKSTTPEVRPDVYYVRPDDDVIVMLSKLLSKNLGIVYRRSRWKYNESEYKTIVTNFIMSYGQVTGLDMMVVSRYNT